MFLSGNYLRIGVNAGGSLGTRGGGCTVEQGCSWGQSGQLGMEQDVDGWDAGEPSATGDFFLPGTQYYQFCIAARESPDGDYLTACNNRVFGANAQGLDSDADTTDTSTGRLLQATTTITTDLATLTLDQTYSFDVSSKRIRVDAELTNTGDSPLYDVAYTITFDPDNDQETGGGFSTINTIEGQASLGDDFTAVCAEGPASEVSVCLSSDRTDSYAFRGIGFGFGGGFGFPNPIATTDPIESETLTTKDAPPETSDTAIALMTIEEGALAPGATSGNLGMYLGLGLEVDVVEPVNEICT